MSARRVVMSTARRAHARQAGFGLVELMVSLALGLLVVGGALVMLSATRQANNTSENLGRIQESVRTSWDLMVREVREAGATPCDAQVLMANVLANGQGNAPTWWGAWDEADRVGDEAVLGVDGATAFAGAPFGAAAAERVAGTEAIVVRYGAPLDGVAVQSHNTATTVLTTNVADHGVAAGDLLMVCNYARGAIFQATAANTAAGTITHATAGAVPGNCSAGLGPFSICTSAGVVYEFTAGSAIGRFVAAGWYIGNNGRPGTGGRSLYRVSAAGAEEITDGVRDMQLRYLESGAAAYVAAAAVTNWANVVAVRFDLVVEGPDAFAATAASAPRLTRNVAFTVDLRNLHP